MLIGGIPDDRDRFEMINRFIVDHAPRNKLNLIIYDGDLMYVHKNLKNTLCFKRLEHNILFSTRPLDSGKWVPFPMTQVITYRKGQEVFRGDRHKGVLYHRWTILPSATQCISENGTRKERFVENRCIYMIFLNRYTSSNLSFSAISKIS